MKRSFLAVFCLSVMLLVFQGLAQAAPTTTPTTPRTARSHKTAGSVQESAHAKKKIAGLRHSSRTAAKHGQAVKASASTSTATSSTAKTTAKTTPKTTATKSVATHTVARTGRRRHRVYEHFTGNSFADNVTEGDIIAGEDPVVRAAAIEALEGMNGTAVAIDPDSGRILAMVNQKLALSSGAEPCSTIKISVALAALQEHLITKDTEVHLGGRSYMTLTEALAKSNNLYFETLGRELGFARVKQYANQFGLGELAGYNIGGEQLGRYPEQPLPEKARRRGQDVFVRRGRFDDAVATGRSGGSAISNGGTLYYLQHPVTPEEIAELSAAQSSASWISLR
jgi:penicillin-binding protein 2